nr:insulinase family protein [Acidobacteriota bacterium]
MTFKALFVLVAAVLTLSASSGQPVQPPAAPGIDLVVLPSAETPLVSLRAMFRAGSIHDPAGKEGLSALTALMVGNSGTAKHTYTEVIDALYPMAAAIGVITDREVVVFPAQVHRDTLEDFTALFEEALLRPGFREDDFRRNKDQLLAFLTTTLRSANDELLGLEMIQQVIFQGHPYGHSPAGTVAGLDAISLDDVRRFHREHYTRANLILGIAGGYAAGYPARLQKAFAALPAGRGQRPALPPPPVVR